jgi:hypothetical protein
MPFLEWHIENLIEKVGGVILLFLPDTHPAVDGLRYCQYTVYGWVRQH